MEKYSQVIFDKNTVEFVTVAAEYCGFLERARDMKLKNTSVALFESDFVASM